MNKLRQFTEGGISILVGTVDAEGMPACVRGVALAPKADDFSVVTLYIPVDTGHETVANIATTRRIAINCTAPVEHASVQLKGTTRGVRLARESEAELVRTRVEEWAAILERIGTPRRITRGMTHWPAFAIDVAVEEIYDQTPGPKAGNPLR
jgi:hypothetical protein